MAEKYLEIKGLEQFQKALRDTPMIAIPILTEALTESIYNLQARVIPKVPIDTGRLRTSIQAPYAVEVQRLVATLGTNVEYAVYVHEGTGKMSPRPFFEEGMKSARSQIMRNLQGALDKIHKTIKYRTESAIQ